MHINVRDRLQTVVARYISEYLWLLLFGLLIIEILVLFRCKKEKIWNALIWIILSFGMTLMHIVSTYFPYRSMLGSTIFLIIADGLLLSSLWDCGLEISKEKHVDIGKIQIHAAKICTFAARILCVFAMAYACSTFIPGTRDIYETWVQITKTEEHILLEAEKGNMEIKIEVPHSSTYYSAIHGLLYIDTANPDGWPNNVMARYYGVNHIIGK